MKISILLPYKENFSPEYPGAVSLFINETSQNSKYKNDIYIYGSTNYKKKFKIEYTKNIPNGDIKKTFSNVNKAKKLIKWKPKVNLDEGIKRFVNWYKLNNDKSQKVNNNYLLQPINPCVDFNPLQNDSKTEC